MFLCLDLSAHPNSLRSAHSPSEIITSVAKIGESFGGVKARIHLGRPGGAPAIFNPTLATLQHRLDHLDQIQVTRHGVRHAAQYLNLAIGFYNDETARENAIKEKLNLAIGQDGSWNTQLHWADGIKPSCC